MQAVVNQNVEKSVHREILALITFPMNMSAFRKEAGELVRIPNKWILRNTTHPMVALDNNVAELSDGTFVKDIYHNNPKFYYGKIEVVENSVPVFTRNGTISRYLTIGQVLKVVSTNDINSILFLGINEREIINSNSKGIIFCPLS
ncbi:hypothetical protein ACQKNX_22455 [Lysinibacillus sp. NPDC093712]|uniref:hypothetical protein n=1 Tax=Lysinibacillus sp. NPDC093712 TaxID=3390579 RepID=UPI003CFE578E